MKHLEQGWFSILTSVETVTNGAGKGLGIFDKCCVSPRGHVQELVVVQKRLLYMLRRDLEACGINDIVTRPVRLHVPFKKNRLKGDHWMNNIHAIPNGRLCLDCHVRHRSKGRPSIQVTCEIKLTMRHT